MHVIRKGTGVGLLLDIGRKYTRTDHYFCQTCQTKLKQYHYFFFKEKMRLIREVVLCRKRNPDTLLNGVGQRHFSNGIFRHKKKVLHRIPR